MSAVIQCAGDIPDYYLSSDTLQKLYAHFLYTVVWKARCSLALFRRQQRIGHPTVFSVISIRHFTIGSAVQPCLPSHIPGLILTFLGFSTIFHESSSIWRWRNSRLKIHLFFAVSIWLSPTTAWMVGSSRRKKKSIGQALSTSPWHWTVNPTVSFFFFVVPSDGTRAKRRGGDIFHSEKDRSTRLTSLEQLIHLAPYPYR